MQTLAGLSETQVLGHGKEGAQLLDGHLFTLVINIKEKQT
ncbi:hypothetical protein PSEUDO9AZ_30023 [Pseudomonas sp. 9AZ]|nr:hypothetical protein PSEUDO9AZ_30023 [Pseudomonas sp. 9AZ]